MKNDVLLDLIRGFIEEPERYWSDDSYFHRRNRLKHRRARKKLENSGGWSPESLAKRFVDLLLSRSQNDVTTLYVMSNGGSGSHYLGALLDGVAGFTTTDEIYFPPALLEQVESSDESVASLAVDFVNLFHVGSVDETVIDTVIVNIGHLRPDVTPGRLAQHDSGGQFVLLLRNPFDVAVSRAFRKEGYRAEVAPDVSDEEYLQRQVNGMKSFLARVDAHRWNRIIRYEHLVANPIAVVGDLAREMNASIQAGSLMRAVDRFNGNDTVRATLGERNNFNTRPGPLLTKPQLDILMQLKESALALGYEETELMKQSRGQRASGTK